MSTTLDNLYTPQPWVQAFFRQGLVARSNAAYAELIGPNGPFRIVGDPIFGMSGAYLDLPIIKRLGDSFVTRRDLTSVSNTTPLAFQDTSAKMVKLSRKIGPVDWVVPRSVSFYKENDLLAEVARQAGEYAIDSIVTSMIASSMGMVAAMTASVHTKDVWSATNKTNFSPELIEQAKSIMSDRAPGTFSHLLAHGTTRLDLRLDAMGRGYDSVGGRALDSDDYYPSLGLRVVLRDDARLTTSDAGYHKYHGLILGPNALKVQFTTPVTIYPVQEDLLTENVIHRWRADFDISIGSDYFCWDHSNGGANPTDGALATYTNWDNAGNQVYGNHKEVPIILVTANASAGSAA